MRCSGHEEFDAVGGCDWPGSLASWGHQRPNSTKHGDGSRWLLDCDKESTRELLRVATEMIDEKGGVDMSGWAGV